MLKSPRSEPEKTTRWRVRPILSRVFIILALVAAGYLGWAFVVSPPYSLSGFYAGKGQCGCGHSSFIHLRDGAVFLHFRGHPEKEIALGTLESTGSGQFRIVTPGNPEALVLTPGLWGLEIAEERSQKSDFYPRDYLFPFSWLMVSQ